MFCINRDCVVIADAEFHFVSERLANTLYDRELTGNCDLNCYFFPSSYPFAVIQFNVKSHDDTEWKYF